MFFSRNIKLDYQKFIDHYWDIFFRHVCQFHDFEISILSKYKYDLKWLHISRNKNIQWTENLLEQFEKQLVWHELTWNEAITWSTPLIEKFEKRLDWYYLGRNKRLPISKAFINQHQKDIFIVEDNIHLTPELIDYYGKNLLPKVDKKTKSLRRKQLRNLEVTLIQKSAYPIEIYDNLYSEYIKKLLDWKSLDEILAAKFDYAQRYFQIQPIQNDIQGLTPEFLIEKNDPFKEYREDRGLFEIKKPIVLTNGSLQEGIPRLYEMPRRSGLSFYPILLVSENLKQLISTFKITEHRFIPVQLKHEQLETNLDFYIFQVDYDSFTKKLDFENLTFLEKYKAGYSGTYYKKQLKKGAIKSYKQIQKRKLELKEIGFNYSEFLPDKYYVDSDWDIFTIENKIIVNEFVKNEIERLLPNQVEFKSVQLLNIFIPQSDYDKKASRTALEIDIKPHQIQLDKDLLFYIKKKERLKKRTEPLNLEQVNSDKFTAIERKLEVKFPESFKLVFLKRF